MNTLNNTYNYNDLSALNAISQTGEDNQADALKAVANQFESMFVAMMLKSMRDANAVFEQDNPLNTNESKFYRQMFDDQLALSMSQGQGIGLADTLYKQMMDQFEVKENKPEGLLPLHDSIQQHGINPFSSLKPGYTLQQMHSALKSHPQAEELPKTAINGTHPREEKTSDAQENRPAIQTEVNMKNASAQAEHLGPVRKQMGFSSPDEFVETIWPIAKELGEKMGIAPKAIVAQAALETGWGKHIIHKGDGNSSHNLFGIKADTRWQGDVAKVSTLEYRQGIAQKEVAPFRVYDSYASSLEDYVNFVSKSERYSQAVNNGDNIQKYTQGLQQGGYATDPNYAQKIQRIASGDVLNDAIERISRG